MLAVLDWLLTIVHVAVVLSFLLLWIPRRTIRVHRWLVVLVALSWFGIGFFEGFGYCFLTDWHWQVKRARGVTGLPGSFLKYAGDWLTGADLRPSLVDIIAATAFICGCTAAAVRYVQARRGRS